MRLIWLLGLAVLVFLALCARPLRPRSAAVAPRRSPRRVLLCLMGEGPETQLKNAMRKALWRASFPESVRFMVFRDSFDWAFSAAARAPSSIQEDVTVCVDSRVDLAHGWDELALEDAGRDCAAVWSHAIRSVPTHLLTAARRAPEPYDEQTPNPAVFVGADKSTMGALTRVWLPHERQCARLLRLACRALGAKVRTADESYATLDGARGQLTTISESVAASRAASVEEHLQKTLGLEAK